MSKPIFFFAAAMSLTFAALPGMANAERLPGKRNLNKTKHGYAIVEDVVRAGQQAQRFEVRAGECGKDKYWNDCRTDRERSEFTVEREWRYGADVWWGYSLYLPEDFETSKKVATTLGQIHQRGGPSGKNRGMPSFPPLLQFEAQGYSFIVRVHMLTGEKDKVVNKSRELFLKGLHEMRGKWTDIVVHFDTSNGKQSLDVYVNGEHERNVINWIEFKPQEYYVKYGIYRSFVSEHGGPMPTQIVYIDEVKIGKKRSQVEVDEAKPVD